MSPASKINTASVSIPGRRFLAWLQRAAWIGLALLTAFSAAPAFGNTITVTTNSDSGPGSLRNAIATANPGDIINFGITGTVTLATTLTIGTNLTISGPGASNLAISGSNIVEVFSISSGVAATISGVTIENGTASNGGGIANNGTLTLTNTTVSGNSGGTAGGIWNNSGTLTVINSTLSGNSSSGGVAGISNDNGTLTLTGSTLFGNAGYYGGGISNGGMATVTYSTLSGNSATIAGGGIINSGTLMVTNSTLSGNDSCCYFGGGGIFNQGMVTVTNSTFSGNSTSNANLGGGGILNEGTLSVTNSTFSGNSGHTYYGDGGGAILFYSGSATLKNTIIAKSPLGGNCFVVSGPTSQGHNLSDDASCSSYFNQSGDLNSTPAGLDPAGLKNNGGPTQTIALLATSPAVDAIPLNPTNYCTDIHGASVNRDQRGDNRPQGSACDIGAFELVIDNDSGFSQLNGGNTFNGNQTVLGNLAATNFVGNGSGLTGVASATASTADFATTANFANTAGIATTAGTATNALALGGNLPAFYATTGANTFNGNEAIASGNLALDNTNVNGTTGVITLGGTPFVHNFGTASTFVGENAGNFNANNTGHNNTAFGYQALGSNTNGFNNTASGLQALQANTGGGFNTAFGYALIYNTTGSNNTAVGFQAGVNENGANANTTGSNNTFLGYSSGPQTPLQLNNATAIGSYAVVNASNALVLGSIAGVNGASSNVNVGIGTATPGYALDVQGGQINASGGLCMAGVCQTTWPSGGGGGGTITGVAAGTGLAGGGSSGNVSLSVDSTVARTNAINAFIGNQTVGGTITATAFSGDGSALTNVNALTAATAVTATSATTAGNASNLNGVPATGFARLDVNGSINLFDAGPGARHGIGIQPAETQFYVPTGGLGHHFSFDRGGDLQPSGTNELMRITDTGMVGIGTIAPAKALDVVGEIRSSGAVTAASFNGNGAGLTGVTATSATSASGLSCQSCVGNGQLGVNYAGSATQGGAANSALTANSATTAATAATATNALALGGNLPGFYATTGSNNFTGNQTIAGGNLALPGTNASGTAGVITLGGVPFLSNFGPVNNYGAPNTFVGPHAGNFTTSGWANMASGAWALSNNVTGANNVASGVDALLSNTTGTLNTATGASALLLNTTGAYNTASGAVALFSNTTGTLNTAIGYQAGYPQNIYNANTTGSNNTFVGSYSGPGVPSSANLQNATAIGANAVVNVNNAIVLGSINGVNGATSSVKVGIGVAAPAYALDVEGPGAQINASGGLCIASVCQTTWPSGPLGTVTSVATGAGLTGGPITSSGTISVANGGITNAMLAPSSVTSADIAAGTIVDSNVNATAAINPTKINGTAAILGANTFAGNQNMPNLFVSGVITSGPVISTASGNGVIGNSTSANGVIGSSVTSNGAAGQSTSGNGVIGVSTSANGVYGVTSSVATNSTSAAGVFNNIAATNPGNIILGQYNSATKFTVDAKGDVAASGSVTIGTGGTAILEHLSGQFTITVAQGAVAPNNCTTLPTIGFAGASDGDSIALGVPNALVAGTAGDFLEFYGWVSAANTVSIRVCNPHGGSANNLASGKIRVDIWKH